MNPNTPIIPNDPLQPGRPIFTDNTNAKRVLMEAGFEWSHDRQKWVHADQRSASVKWNDKREMFFIDMIDAKGVKIDRNPYLTTTHGMSGHFAVLIWWNPEHGGFEEPYQTGIGRYETKAEAEQEARQWSESDEIELRL